jgi:hypothetical protein
LFDVVVEPFRITLHFFDDELQFVLLPLLLLSQSFQMFLFDLVLSIPVPHLILQLLYLFPLVLSLLIVLLPFLLPSVLDILDQLGVFSLNPHDFLMQAFNSGV